MRFRESRGTSGGFLRLLRCMRTYDIEVSYVIMALSLALLLFLR